MFAGLKIKDHLKSWGIAYLGLFTFVILIAAILGNRPDCDKYAYSYGSSRTKPLFKVFCMVRWSKGMVPLDGTGRIKAADLKLLRLDMSKQEVVAILGRPEFFPMEYGSNGFESFRYFEDLGSSGINDHELVFYSGKLKLYGSANDPTFRNQVELLHRAHLK
jgi:hypothetical protein